jgi:site-specific DNA recombinase
MKEGRHVNQALKGYKNARDENNNPIIVPSKDAPLITWSFEEVAKGVHAIIEVWRMAKEKGLSVGKSQFWNILKIQSIAGRFLFLLTRMKKQL